MSVKNREFQIFVKPVGATCNLNCRYCYYLEKIKLFSNNSNVSMDKNLLEEYINQHINASTSKTIMFSWHGGEPLLAGLDFYKHAVAVQKNKCPSGSQIINGIQTNGTLLDENWCRFFAQENFYVGLSIDGPKDLHNIYRYKKDGSEVFDKLSSALAMLNKYNINTEILCVVHNENVKFPLKVYNFFKRSGATQMTFLPLVIRNINKESGVDECSVPSEAFGDFMICIFDEWLKRDIGKVKIQLFEEATRKAFNIEHTLCIFKKECGGVPVIEHNGDFYSCDHYVDENHLIGNIKNSSIEELIDSEKQKAFGRNKFESLPLYCISCEVMEMCNGECPKNRFITTPDGEAGLNYLCVGYKKFFTHCLPFINAVSKAWQMKNSPNLKSSTPSPQRNETCPCGSGKKYKHCCMNKK